MPLPDSLVGLYRSVLQQARTLSHTWGDRTILKSHSYIARRNLEPLLKTNITQQDVERWPPSSKIKRLQRAKKHVRHLSQANAGSTPYIERAFWQAYARTGKIRRDTLSLLSPTRSDDSSQERYPLHLRDKVLHPLLETLLTTSGTMRGSVSRPSHLVRPPPPYLPTLDDPIITTLKKPIGRRRMIYARNRWLSRQMKKIILPLSGELMANLVNKAMTIPPPIPRRCKGKGIPLQKKLDGHRPRFQRRLYARLLESAPALLLEPRPKPIPTGDRNDPLGSKATMQAVIEGQFRYKILKSDHAIVKRGRRPATYTPTLSPDEAEFLKSAALWS